MFIHPYQYQDNQDLCRESCDEGRSTAKEMLANTENSGSLGQMDKYMTNIYTIELQFIIVGIQNYDFCAENLNMLLSGICNRATSTYTHAKAHAHRSNLDLSHLSTDVDSNPWLRWLTPGILDSP